MLKTLLIAAVKRMRTGMGMRMGKSLKATGWHPTLAHLPCARSPHEGSKTRGAIAGAATTLPKIVTAMLGEALLLPLLSHNTMVKLVPAIITCATRSM